MNIEEIVATKDVGYYEIEGNEDVLEVIHNEQNKHTCGLSMYIWRYYGKDCYGRKQYNSDLYNFPAATFRDSKLTKIDKRYIMSGDGLMYESVPTYRQRLAEIKTYCRANLNESDHLKYILKLCGGV